MININTPNNDYIIDGDLLTQMSSMTLMFAAMGVLISPIF